MFCLSCGFHIQDFQEFIRRISSIYRHAPFLVLPTSKVRSFQNDVFPREANFLFSCFILSKMMALESRIMVLTGPGNHKVTTFRSTSDFLISIDLQSLWSFPFFKLPLKKLKMGWQTRQPQIRLFA